MTAEPLCNECKERKVTVAGSPEAVRARELGLCIRCLQTPGVRAKWREKLGLPANRGGRPNKGGRGRAEMGEVAGEERCALCHTGKLSDGKGKAAKRAQALGICLRCLNTPGFVRERGSNSSCRNPVDATGLSFLLDRAERLIDDTAALYVQLGKLTEVVRVACDGAKGSFARLRERARALEKLRASVEKQLAAVEKHLQARGKQFMGAKRAARRAVRGGGSA